MKLWLDKVGNILRAGLKPEDYSKYWPVSQELEILKGVYEDNIYQEEYLRKITNYEIALKSIIQKYEILWMEGKRDKGGEVEKMDKAQDGNMLDELKTYLQELKSYKKLRQLEEELLSRIQLGRRESLKEKLIRKTSGLKTLIIELTGRQYVSSISCGKFECWSEAFNTTAFSNDVVALDFCINATNEAIGKLQSEIKQGIRDEQGNSIEKEKISSISAEPPKAFIAHEGDTPALNKLKSFLETLGVKCLIAEIEPSDGRLVEPQVDGTQEQADFAIIFATKGKVINKMTGKPQMGTNVADELGRARKVFGNKMILLLQKGVEAHSNVSGIVHERFTPQSMDKAFTKVVKELRKWCFLKLEKPEE